MKNGNGQSKKNGSAMRPFSRSLPMQLLRAREAVMQRFRAHFTSHGFSEQQWRILRVLVEAPRLEVGELAAHCHIHPASLSRMLPKLVRDGIVVRSHHRTDQRRVVVSLTAKGRARFRAAAPESEEIYAAIERRIGARRLAGLYRLLDDLIASAPARTDREAAAGRRRTHRNRPRPAAF